MGYSSGWLVSSLVMLDYSWEKLENNLGSLGYSLAMLGYSWGSLGYNWG